MKKYIMEIMHEQNTQKQPEKVNPMCENCGKFGGECQGTMEKVWTGCIYKIHKEEKAMAEKFELWFGCLGNGTTVCNKVATENGDYKTIAHISEGGNIRLYVTESYIPAEAMEKIRAMANRTKAEFMKRFESLPEVEQYGKILDRVQHQNFMEFVGDKRPLAEKLPGMREYYYSIM